MVNIFKVLLWWNCVSSKKRGLWGYCSILRSCKSAAFMKWKKMVMKLPMTYNENAQFLPLTLRIATWGAQQYPHHLLSWCCVSGACARSSKTFYTEPQIHRGCKLEGNYAQSRGFFNIKVLIGSFSAFKILFGTQNYGLHAIYPNHIS